MAKKDSRESAEFEKIAKEWIARINSITAKLSPEELHDLAEFYTMIAFSRMQVALNATEEMACKINDDELKAAKKSGSKPAKKTAKKATKKVTKKSGKRTA